jgi:hypothetical protein
MSLLHVQSALVWRCLEVESGAYGKSVLADQCAAAVNEGGERTAHGVQVKRPSTAVFLWLYALLLWDV